MRWTSHRFKYGYPRTLADVIPSWRPLSGGEYWQHHRGPISEALPVIVNLCYSEKMIFHLLLFYRNELDKSKRSIFTKIGYLSGPNFGHDFCEFKSPHFCKIQISDRERYPSSYKSLFKFNIKFLLSSSLQCKMCQKRRNCYLGTVT